MDFGALLHIAKKKVDETKEQQLDGKFYNTKYSPPKKVSKESKQLSNNIQKFLKKKEAEEAEKRREKNQKVAELMAKRDEKSKNKIRKMLKVTKSANKSVLNDCSGTGAEHETGEGQGDDYGYTSNEANALYEKYLAKVQHVEDNKSFAPSRPQSLRDLSGTKERVKAAIDRERQDAESHTRAKRGTNTNSSSSSTGTSKPASGSGSGSTKSQLLRASSKTLYDPEAEKREEENKKRLAEQQNRAKLKRVAQAPPMDFQALLRLAEKKQHEPVVFAQPEKKKEPERLLSAKEKREAEERQRYREERAQRDKLRESGGENKPKPSQGPNRMEPNGRIPKLCPTKTSPASTDAKAKAPIATFKRPAPLPAKASSSSASSNPSASQSSHSPSSNRNPVASTKLSSSSSSNNSKTVASVGSKPAAQAQKPSSSGSSSKMPPLSRNPYAAAVKNGAVREFPPRDRPAGSGTLAKKPKIAPVDAKGRPGKQQPSGNKRRICDDDSEYDSELDDFIDDGDCEEDISSHIRSIFGYDRRRYKDQDDDDRDMESSFAQMQREELISQKLGLQEDLEDMRKEAMHKKQKMARKRSKRLDDDSDDD
ncbi:protein SPT2 homolog isoform X2 [Drosophila serrata]|uniref:protein SPT2 homolog isoform X2 n=1 Tax=Drosophila serrata TaxID=7274 RepID=UPI000A1D1B95|nr:protein SPT2 homolog isoform X2 [Drosophila serrata]